MVSRELNNSINGVVVEPTEKAKVSMPAEKCYLPYYLFCLIVNSSRMSSGRFTIQQITVLNSVKLLIFHVWMMLVLL